MKIVIAALGSVVSALLGTSASACIPVPPNANADSKADAVFFGVVIAKRQLPSEGPLIESYFTIKTSNLVKGSAPKKLEVAPSCGGYYPSLNERVIVVRRGKYNIIRRAGGQYERLLLSTFRHGR
jgi:hypothetical protein